MTQADDTVNLCYQELVDGYYRNLNDTLRNFKGGPGFLETWVHDENYGRSILEIIDLAVASGLNRVNIQVSSDIAGSIDFGWLQSELKSVGWVESVPHEKECLIQFRTHAMPEKTVSETYRSKLEEAAPNIAHEHSPHSPLPEGRQLTAQDGEKVLRIVVDEKGMVIFASHEGAQGLYRPLLDIFCSILEGRTLQEGAEHGIIRLENFLRNETLPKDKGILLARNADPGFDTPLKLIREIYRDYLQSAPKVERNYWRDPIPEQWLALSLEERKHQVEGALQELYAAHEFNKGELKIVEVKNEKRVVLEYPKTAAPAKLANALISIEREVRRRFVGVEIELEFESHEDRNKREQRTNRG